MCIPAHQENTIIIYYRDNENIQIQQSRVKSFCFFDLRYNTFARNKGGNEQMELKMFQNRLLGKEQTIYLLNIEGVYVVWKRF